MRRKTTKYVIIHCSDTPDEMDIGAAEIDSWHRKRGFSQIGYHFVIRRDGRIELGRDLMDVGAHCKAEGRNHDSVGICLVGRKDFAPEQMEVLRELVNVLAKIWPEALVRGHRDYEPGKTCPNFDVTTWKWCEQRKAS